VTRWRGGVCSESRPVPLCVQVRRCQRARACAPASFAIARTRLQCCEWKRVLRAPNSVTGSHHCLGLPPPSPQLQSRPCGTGLPIICRHLFHRHQLDPALWRHRASTRRHQRADSCQARFAGARTVPLRSRQLGSSDPMMPSTAFTPRTNTCTHTHMPEGRPTARCCARCRTIQCQHRPAPISRPSGLAPALHDGRVADAHKRTRYMAWRGGDHFAAHKASTAMKIAWGLPPPCLTSRASASTPHHIAHRGVRPRWRTRPPAHTRTCAHTYTRRHAIANDALRVPPITGHCD